MNQFYGISESKIKEYARMIVCVGANVQKGQTVVLSCPVDHYEFAHYVIEEAYKAGASEVVMRWSDSFETKQYYLNASEEALKTLPDWKAESYNYYSRIGAAHIGITGGDPENLKGVDMRRLAIREEVMELATEEHSKRMMNCEVAWTVAAVPHIKWAKKMMPELEEAEAMAKLWELILKASRVWDGNAVENWKQHDARLKEKCKMLTEAAFTKLHYKNSLGTDFVVGLCKNHIWEGGSATSALGVDFEANTPTEEIFTAPDRLVAEGTLVSAMPLSYSGNLIKDFTLVFHEGKVVDYSAKEGYDALKKLIDTDEGSKRLGEVAIVPYSSPISQMNTLFFNTLFDENASCHFALGRCYPTNILGGDQMDKETIEAAGGNMSMAHVDFMVGTRDLTITGIKEDGSKVVIFDQGDWVD